MDRSIALVGLVAYATASVFAAHGVQPMLGRGLRPEEREGPGTRHPLGDRGRESRLNPGARAEIVSQSHQLF